MAVAFRSTDNSSWSSPGTRVVTKPSGLSTDDLMIAHLVIADSGTTTDSFDTPSGWTLLTENDDTNAGNRAYSKIVYKIADAGDVAASNFSFTMTTGGAGGICIAIVSAWSGVDTTTPLSTGTSLEESSSATLSCTAITPSVADSVICIVATLDNDGRNPSSWAITTSDPGGWTEAYDTETALAGDGLASLAYSSARSATTSTGTGTASLAGAGLLQCGQMFAIYPSGGGGGGSVVQDPIGMGFIPFAR